MEYVSNAKIAGWWGPPCKQPVISLKIAGSSVPVNRGARRIFRWQERCFKKFERLYKDLTERHLDDWGGLCRNVTGIPGPVTTEKASKHAWWLADDIDADENVRGTDPFKSEIWVKGGNGDCVRLLEATGFTWGGRFSTPDPHHFEVAVSPEWIRKHFTVRGTPKRFFKKQLRAKGFAV